MRVRVQSKSPRHRSINRRRRRPTPPAIPPLLPLASPPPRLRPGTRRRRRVRRRRRRARRVTPRVRRRRRVRTRVRRTRTRPGPAPSTRSPRAAGRVVPAASLRLALASPRPVARTIAAAVVAPAPAGGTALPPSAGGILRPSLLGVGAVAVRRPVGSVALRRPPRAPRRAPRLALALAALSPLRRLGVPPRTARAPLPPLLLPLAPLEVPSDVPAREIERSDRARGVAPAARVALLEVEGVALPAEPVPGGGLLALGALAVARLVVVREEIVARGIRPGRPAVEAVSGALPMRGAPIALVGVDVPAVRAVARALQELAAQTRVRHRARLRRARWV